ncbi:MOSC N-terminal beta barrel domain-containing protein [Kitasatospora aureofaciens]|uniref:MOSC domain-containing protein n=1 Tax=Kitasatospora aureofaciens TaxID=1894 RepID=UPI000A6AC3B7|nr:MOSC N-terminal beta barrel domain-containing protein [Kitasatospora aureofaciens]HJD81451.1 MOSC N-terminal beta barrel domain-containing protein [Kitasatospora aureofaciens]
MLIGQVERLRRYPVKSLLGEELSAAEVTGRGVAGDRERALLDLATGRVASAKHPRLWAGLLRYSAAATADGRVAITGPDGRAADEAELSEALGRKLALIAERPPGAAVERAVPEEVLARGIEAEVAVTVNELGRGVPEGGFFDFAPVHLITEATLRAVGVEAERYRPNLVLRTEGEGFVENAWVGRELAVGETLRLRIVAPTPRCAVPTLGHGSLPRRAEALRVPAERNRLVPLEGIPALPCAGVYAQVLAPGRVEPGVEVRLN